MPVAQKYNDYATDVKVCSCVHSAGFVWVLLCVVAENHSSVKLLFAFVALPGQPRWLGSGAGDVRFFSFSMEGGSTPPSQINHSLVTTKI